MFCHHRGIDASAHLEFGRQPREFRLQRGHQVIHNPVGNGLMEMPFGAVAPYVQFECLELHTKMIGNVFEQELGKIGLTGFGAQAGEFGYPNSDGIISSGSRVREAFQDFAGRGRHSPLATAFSGANTLHYAARTGHLMTTIQHAT
jgi:hypothetical protein